MNKVFHIAYMSGVGTRVDTHNLNIAYYLQSNDSICKELAGNGIPLQLCTPVPQ